MKKAAPIRGRRTGKPDTKATIERAARERFDAQGYHKTSIRAIARDANVDSALVHHYFGSKRTLFAAVTSEEGSMPSVGRRPPPAVPLNGGRSEALSGEEIVRRFVERWDPHDGPSVFGTLLRAAASDPEAELRLAAIVNASVAAPIAGHLAGKASMTKLRTTLIAAQLIGLAWQRYVTRTDPVASATASLLARIYGPSVTATLEGLDFRDRDRSA